MVTTTATITMSMREADRLKTIQAVVDRMARVGQAVQRLGLSRRQLERLVQRHKDEGVAGPVSRKRGRPSNRQLAPGVAKRATALIRDRYADFGPTLACEKLRECHGLPLAKETVRVLMMAAGLWTPRKQRTTKIHHLAQRRVGHDRLDHFGRRVGDEVDDARREARVSEGLDDEPGGAPG